MVDTLSVAETPLQADNPYEMRINLGQDVPDVTVREALASGDAGFLHSFTTGSGVDGPGMRVVAWTTSCMFRCQFCHNPDTWTLSNGQLVTLERATEELRKYAHGLKAMHGGLTISGGEPLMQDRFVAKLFDAAKKLGVHTALQTNGYYGSKLSDEELQDIDLVILDMKAFNAGQHKRVTGIADNTPVVKFCIRLAMLNRPMWLRYVLVPGLTDIPAEMKHIAQFASALGIVKRVEILPFHQMGRYKWHRLGLDYKLENVEPPTPETVESAIAIFRAAGLETV
jgi:pyruvate formate lyase activating enzyme